MKNSSERKKEEETYERRARKSTIDLGHLQGPLFSKIFWGLRVSGSLPARTAMKDGRAACVRRLLWAAPSAALKINWFRRLETPHQIVLRPKFKLFANPSSRFGEAGEFPFELAASGEFASRPLANITLT